MKYRNDNEQDYNKWIGKVVSKQSRCAFKSGSKVNTVKGVVIHPITSRISFVFEEDGSIVECRMCTLVS